VNLSFSNGYTVTLTPDAEEGYSVFQSTGAGENKIYGITKYYSFQISAEYLYGSSSFDVSAPYERAATFPMIQRSFIVPSLTHFTNQTVYITVAVPSGEDILDQLQATVAAPVPQPLTLAPVIKTGQAAWIPESTIRGGLVLRTAVYEIGEKITGGLSVKLLLGGAVVDNLILGAGVAGW